MIYFISQVQHRTTIRNYSAPHSIRWRINDESTTTDSNVYSNSEADIKVDTVHPVKGETHIATLYMETSYHKKCESEYLWEQFKGHAYVQYKGDTYKKEALKIAYMAFGRP